MQVESAAAEASRTAAEAAAADAEQLAAEAASGNMVEDGKDAAGTILRNTNSSPLLRLAPESSSCWVGRRYNPFNIAEPASGVFCMSYPVVSVKELFSS